MFTGLIEDMGTLRSARRISGGMRLAVRTALAAELESGESIAVDGACLTVLSVGGGLFEADVSAETLSKTTLGGAIESARLNLERAVRPSDRLGGHMMTGHVDGTGRIAGLIRSGDFLEVEVRPDTPLEGAILLKGSVGIDGVSLTVSAVEEDRFSVTLIPETLKRTTLSSKRVGSSVNLETDIIGKYVEEYLRRGSAAERGTTSASFGRLFREGLREGG